MWEHLAETQRLADCRNSPFECAAEILSGSIGWWFALKKEANVSVYIFILGLEHPHKHIVVVFYECTPRNINAVAAED